MDPFDLDAYLRRIGHTGPAAADLATLAAVVQRHRHAIAFENVDGLVGRTPRLDLAALQAKLVAGGRGGYCYEQNGLLRAALERLGFVVATLEGRVRIGNVPTPARTHSALRVTLDGVAWLADVGFGALSPGCPLRLDSRAEVRHDGEPWRLQDADPAEDGHVDGWTLQGITDRHWIDFYRLHAVPSTAVDEEVGNWFVATNPQAMLKRNLVVSRPLGGGTRLALLNDRLTTRRPGAKPERRLLASRAEFADVLADGFGLRIAAADLDAVLALIAGNERAAATNGPR